MDAALTNDGGGDIDVPCVPGAEPGVCVDPFGPREAHDKHQTVPSGDTTTAAQEKEI